MEITRNLRKERIGVVSSNKGDKTITVMVKWKEKHPIYGKFVNKTKKYHAHDENNECGIGDTVKVHAKVKEGNRERIQVFEGIVIRFQNGGLNETFTVRKLSSGIGVEKPWPLHSPKIVKIETVRKGVVRRAKLFYLRNRVGKAAKVKEAISKKTSNNVSE